MDKIDRRCRARHRGAAGGRRRRHHVRQRERPALSAEGDAGGAGRHAPSRSAALKPMIKVPFGVNYLWDPVATVALAVATGAQVSHARSSPASMPPTWASGRPTAAERAAAARRSRAAPTSSCCSTSMPSSPRRSATAADRASGRRARCSRRWPTSSWCPGR